MSDYLLTDEERQRFLRWLERQAESSRAMLSQFESLPAVVAQALISKEKQELAGYLIVARILRNTESMSITADDSAAIGD